MYFHCDDTREYHSLLNSLTSGQGITLDLRSTILYSIRNRYVAASVILTAMENIREFALVMKEAYEGASAFANFYWPCAMRPEYTGMYT